MRFTFLTITNKAEQNHAFYLGEYKMEQETNLGWCLLLLLGVPSAHLEINTRVSYGWCLLIQGYFCAV